MRHIPLQSSFAQCVTRWVIVSAYLSAQLTVAHADEVTTSRGRAIAQACVVCHGPDGQSSGAIPSLKGISAQQLRTAMLAFRTGERTGTVMNRLARGLDEDDIEAVSQYFSSLPRR
jgi:cytochrome c553